MGKRTNNNYRSRKSPLTAVFLLAFLILGLLLVGVFWKFHQEIKGLKLLGKERINLVIGGDSLQLISLNTHDKTAVLVPLTGELYTEIPGDYGQYRLKNVYELGNLDQKGGQLLSLTVEDLLGIPVDGFLTKDFFTERFLNLDFVFDKNKSDLSLLDRLYLLVIGLLIRGGGVDEINLADSDVISPVLLADGTEASALDASRFDFLFGERFTEKQIQQEKLRVEILNAGDTSGLGAVAGRILTNIGVNVVNVGNLAIPVDRCEVRTRTQQNSRTAKRIAELFGCRILSRQDDGRADITLILRSLRPDE